MAKMMTVHVKAQNLKKGDIINGQRVNYVTKHSRRDGLVGVVVLLPNTNGYGIDVSRFKGTDKVVIKRPKYNMKYRRKPIEKKQKVGDQTLNLKITKQVLDKADEYKFIHTCAISTAVKLQVDQVNHVSTGISCLTINGINYFIDISHQKPEYIYTLGSIITLTKR